MEEIRLGGSIALVGFDKLEPVEITIVKKITGTYVKKMQENGSYQDLKLVLQQHKHGKSFKHEITAQAQFVEGRFGATVTDWNLFKALSETLEKIISEINHKRKKEIRKEKIIEQEEKPIEPM